jgi:transposase
MHASDPPQSCVGIDVSKARLDVAVRPSGETWSYANDEPGIADLLVQLQAVQPAPQLVVLEATGGLERAAVAALALAGLPVAGLNPRQVRDFAKATGRLAKTDALDAAVLAHFADALRPAPRPLPDAQSQRLAALVERRRQLVGLLTAERNRAPQTLPTVRPHVQAHIAWLEQALHDLDRELDQTLQASPLWREREDLLRSVPGVGPIVSRTLLAHLPELGQGSARARPGLGQGSARARASTWPRWWAWRRSTATAAPGGAPAPSGAAVGRCALCSTWPPWSACAITRCCGPSTRSWWRAASPRRSP